MVLSAFLELAYPSCPGKRPFNGCSSNSIYVIRDVSEVEYEFECCQNPIIFGKSEI